MRRGVNIGVLITLILASLISCIPIQHNRSDDTNVIKPVSKEGFLLGTYVVVKMYDSEDEEILDKVFDRLEEIENRMSIKIDDSDISKINKNAGLRPVKVHDDVYFVLQKAKTYAEITGGAFEPTIGALVKLWGIGSGDERIPTQSEIDVNLAKVNFNKLKLLQNYRVFLEDSNMILDLGAIAKGYAADETKRILQQNGVNSAIIDLGGNVLAVGSKPNGSSWRIAIQNPFENRGNYIGVITESDISVVSSGDYERYFEENDKRYHHIIDSLTGYPAWNNVAGVSVLSKKSIEGDALSTALFVLGVEKGIKLVNEMEDVDVIYVTKDNKIYISSRLQDKFKLIVKGFELIIP